MPRVSGMDVMFLYGETPSWHMHTAALLVLDPASAPGGLDADALSAFYERRLASAAQFRWKVHHVAFGLDRPAVVEDPAFDLSNHVHRVDVPAPGGPREVGGIVGELLARKLDRSHPLWEVWVLEGLAGGRLALLTKIHHSIIDGMSGVDLANRVLDLSPVPAPPPPAPHLTPEPAPSFVGGLASALGAALRAPYRTARYAAQTLDQGVVLGRHLLGGTTAGLPFAAARSAVNGPLTARRTLAYTSVPIADVTRVKEAFRVKVNDVVLAVVSGSLRAWLLDRGELPRRSLVAEVPVSVRSEATRDHVGTQVANSFVTLATDVASPVERLRAIHRSSLDARDLQRDLAERKRVNLSDVPPPRLLGLAVRAFGASGLEARLPPIYSVIVSSVAGPQLDFYVAGARVEAVYPVGPLMYASGVNVTALTLGDHVHFGIVACPDVVADPWAIADAVPAALAELLAARASRRTRAAPARRR